MDSGKGRRAPHEGLNWRSYGLAFGDRVRTLRHTRGLSQEALADSSGVSRNIVSAIETNAHHRGTPANPRLDTVYRLALGLGVPPGALMPDVDELVTPDASSNRPGAAADMAWPERYSAFIDTFSTSLRESDRGTGHS